MTTRRLGVAVAVLGGYLYAIGMIFTDYFFIINFEISFARKKNIIPSNRKDNVNQIILNFVL